MNTAMISRIADHLFWFGRYVERVDSTARLLYVTRNLVLDADLPAADVWLPVLEATGEDGPFLARQAPGGDIPASADGEAVERYLTWDEQSFVSLVQSVRFARENAWSIRSTVSLEVWQATNELYLWLAEPAARTLFETRRHDFYRHIQRATQLIFGLTQSTMLHDQALDLVWLGALLERAGQVARTLDTHHELLASGPGLAPAQSQGQSQSQSLGQSQAPAPARAPTDAPRSFVDTTEGPRPDPAVAAVTWLAVLRACSASEPFAKRRPGQTTGPGVADFLLFERDFPRAVAFALGEARAALVRLCPPDLPELPAQRTVARLDALCAWLDAQRGDHQGRLHDVLTHLVDETAEVCRALGRDLFGFG